MTSKKIAFVFPGQGSQSFKMLNSMAIVFPQIKQTFAKASERLGYDTWQIIQEGPVERLNSTVYTQPILLIANVALWRLWNEYQGAAPQFLVGHSLGEYAAYTCSKTISFEQAVQLVAKRGALMQEAVDGVASTMAVIVGLPSASVVAICDQVKHQAIVALSNYNTLDQVTISGHTEAVERAMQKAKQQGARLVKKLPISVATHCDLMRPASSLLVKALQDIAFQLPDIPVISNTYSLPLKDVEAIKQSLVVQLYQPVHWVNNIQYLLQQGVNCFIECGPNRVLTTLIRRIAPHTEIFSIGNEAGFKKALAQTFS